MPIHDWTRLKAGMFHDFHHSWIEEIKRALNGGCLPGDYYAMAEQVAGGLGPDVLTLQDLSDDGRAEEVDDRGNGGGLALATVPPHVRFRITDEPLWYTTKAKSVVVRHVSDHQVIAIVEIVSPGNKNSQSGFDAFVSKAREIIAHGVHLLVVDVFPPSKRDPEGIHAAIYGNDNPEQWHFDLARPLTSASYIGGVAVQAFVQPMAVGDELTPMPLFLRIDEYVNVPLEESYNAAFEAVPKVWQRALTKTA